MENSKGLQGQLKVCFLLLFKSSVHSGTQGRYSQKNILLKSRILFLNLMLFDLKRSGLKLLPGLMNILSAIIFLMIADYAHI